MKLALPLAVAALSVSGCLPNPVGLQQQQQSTIDPTILERSCADLAQMDTNIITRINEIEAEERKKRRNQALSNAAVNVGLGALLGGSVGGGVDSIRAADATARAVTSVRAANQGMDGLRTVQDVTALANVRSQVVRAQIQKGCA